MVHTMIYVFIPFNRRYGYFDANCQIPAALSAILSHHHFMVNDIPDDDELAHLREKRLREMEMEMGGMTNFSPRSHVQIIEVTDMNFTELVQSHRYLLVDCWAEWCGPCMNTALVIEELAGEFADVVTFGKCDADMNAGVMRAFQISAIPTLLFFAGGYPAGRLTGAYPKESIRAALLRTFEL